MALFGCSKTAFSADIPLLKPPSADEILSLPGIAPKELIFPFFEEQTPKSKLSEPLAKEIRAAVKSLEYSDEVAEDFVKLVSGWNCDALKQNLDRAKQDFRGKKIGAAKVAQAEENAARELYRRIGKETSSVTLEYDLAEIIKNKKANCFGYAQLFYILGNALGLNVKIIDVLELARGSLSSSDAHVACLVDFSDGESMMADLSHRFASKPFVLREEFAEDGISWILKDKSDPLHIHRKIRILDEDEIVVTLYHCRETDCIKSGKYPEAVDYDNRAIDLKPKDARNYVRRGYTFYRMGEFAKAIPDFDRAIEIDPKYCKAYLARGNANESLGKADSALSDFNKAVELEPNNAEAYHYRGISYAFARKHGEAIEAYNKAIDLDSKDSDVYCNRAISFMNMGKAEQANGDITKALELNPKNAQAYYLRGISYANSGKYTEALPNFTQALEFEPKNAAAYSYTS